MERLTLCFTVLFMYKVNFENKSGTSHWEISVSCTIQECDQVTTPYYPISTLLSGRSGEVKNRRKFQTLWLKLVAVIDLSKALLIVNKVFPDY